MNISKHIGIGIVETIFNRTVPGHRLAGHSATELLGLHKDLERAYRPFTGPVDGEIASSKVSRFL